MSQLQFTVSEHEATKQDAVPAESALHSVAKALPLAPVLNDYSSTDSGQLDTNSSPPDAKGQTIIHRGCSSQPLMSQLEEAAAHRLQHLQDVHHRG